MPKSFGRAPAGFGPGTPLDLVSYFSGQRTVPGDGARQTCCMRERPRMKSWSCVQFLYHLGSAVFRPAWETRVFKARKGVAFRPRLECLEAREVPANLHFDFGKALSPVAAGYLGVPVVAYNSVQGYGWQSTSGIS